MKKEKLQYEGSNGELQEIQLVDGQELAEIKGVILNLRREFEMAMLPFPFEGLEEGKSLALYLDFKEEIETFLRLNPNLENSHKQLLKKMLGLYAMLAVLVGMALFRPSAPLHFLVIAAGSAMAGIYVIHKKREHLVQLHRDLLGEIAPGIDEPLKAITE